MKRFSLLYADLDSSTSITRKCDVLADYFRQAPARDAAWAVYFLSGGKQRRILSSALMQAAACEMAAIPQWLFDQCYQTVGDLAETIAHLLPATQSSLDQGLADFIETTLLPLRLLPADEALSQVRMLWMQMSASQRFLSVKWVGGGFRVGVSRGLVTRALAQATGISQPLLAQRMMVFTTAGRQPAADDFERLTAPEGSVDSQADLRLHPYPFFLAHPLSDSVSSLGCQTQWLAEWKYDGIRAQVVKRGGQVCIWSRGEELINDSFPELLEMASAFPDGIVLDGEILLENTTAQGRVIGSFADLQTRLGRKRVDNKLRMSHPVVFMAYDLLQWQGQDCRTRPQSWRREQLVNFFSVANAEASALRLSESLVFSSWESLTLLRQDARWRGVEGVMLKSMDCAYGVGRTKTQGVWWKWKLDPMSVDAVLVYAQAGHGRRANLFTDYTFAVWDRQPNDDEVQQVCEAISRRETPLASQDRGLPRLVTFAKAYSGLTDAQFKQVDKIIREHAVDKFGPVRSVIPSLVFELGFEGIALSGRHKSGVAVRFPRMLRIREDKRLSQANTLADLKALLGMQP